MNKNQIKSSLAVVAALGSLLCFSASAQAERWTTDTGVVVDDVGYGVSDTARATGDVVADTWGAITSPSWLSTGSYYHSAPVAYRYYDDGYTRGYRSDIPTRKIVEYRYVKPQCDKVHHFRRDTRGHWTHSSYRSC